MKIVNEFTVNAPVGQAWEVLTDLEQMVPLIPGAQMTGWEGEQFLGKLKVKIGPVTSDFSGKASFVERDDGDHRAVIAGTGRDTRGSGNATATIITQARADGDQTRVTVDTDLKVVGKLAQFGGGVLQQVSEKLIGQFAASLEAKLAAGGADTSAQAAGADAPHEQPAARSGGRHAQQPATQSEPAPLDLVGLVAPALIKKYAPAIAFAVAAVLAMVVVRRRMRAR
ncbi:SRPBCC family protein [Nocardia sp. CNY236]|uniref:SRPBCC family protein n=1 Tax=Nocardia sp. CNY236 TaxID=1169152 RepID=UPI0003FEF61C|nr:SRPBCC family protein [Nocardia sp. CNY236]